MARAEINLAEAASGPTPATEARRRKMLAKALDFLSKEMDGRYTRTCPLCGYTGPFAPYRERIDSRCPSCDSRPHHRLFKLWLDRTAPIGKDQSLLHFAPEIGLAPFLRDLAGSYRSCDLDPERGDLTLDITALDLPDASEDVVICHQVLEHVDDARAIAEIFRILRPGGFAVFTTPVEEGWEHTYHNPAAQDRKARQLHHGQGDHVRFYGRDLRQRLAAPGFELTEYVAVEPDVSAHALERGTRLFIATRPRPTKGRNT
jgi:SAM-dependent methyltransferase